MPFILGAILLILGAVVFGVIGVIQGRWTATVRNRVIWACLPALLSVGLLMNALPSEDRPAAGTRAVVQNDI